MNGDAAEQTLRAIVRWDRYAEAFASDEQSGALSLENTTSSGQAAIRKHPGRRQSADLLWYAPRQDQEDPYGAGALPAQEYCRTGRAAGRRADERDGGEVRSRPVAQPAVQRAE